VNLNRINASIGAIRDSGTVCRGVAINQLPQPCPIGGYRFSGRRCGLALHTSPITSYQHHRPIHSFPQIYTMRWLFSSAAVLAWSAVVAAKSFTGDRLLVILEEQSEREKYSVFLEDLSCKLSFCSFQDESESQLRIRGLRASGGRNCMQRYFGTRGYVSLRHSY
jgi:hypothetical protein